LPLPIVFDDELREILDERVASIIPVSKSALNAEKAPRYVRLLEITIPSLLSSTRDVLRVASNFALRYSMVSGDVDWVDVLGFTVLAIKAPSVAAHVREHPEDFVFDSIRPRFLLERDRTDFKEIYEGFAPVSERSSELRALTGFLFPALSRDRSSTESDADEIAFRRPLLTLLRLRLIPGAVAREHVRALVELEPDELKAALQNLPAERLIDFVSRLSEVYDDIPDIRHDWTWALMGIAAENLSTRSYEASYQRKRAIRAVADEFVALARRNRSVRSVLTRTLRYWLREHAYTVAAALLRRLLSRKGVTSASLSQEWELNEEEVQRMAAALIDNVRKLPDWPKKIDLLVFYLANDLHLWEGTDRADFTTALLSDDEFFDSFIFQSFGGSYTSDKEAIELFLPFSDFSSKVQSRVRSPVFRSLSQEIQGAYHHALLAFDWDKPEVEDAVIQQPPFEP
jgi:hypothetical protein